MPDMDRFAPTISPSAIGLDTNALAKAILAAPAWARVGITAPKMAIREAAAQELAFSLAGQLSHYEHTQQLASAH